MNFQKIHELSPDSTHSELDLFSLPPTSGQIERFSYITCQPLANPSNESPLEFLTKGTDEYIDLAKTYLRLKIRLVKADGTNINTESPAGTNNIPPAVQAADVGPVNNIIHSLFSQLDIYLNEQLISTSNTLYPYRAYFESLLNHSNESRKSQLTCSLYYQDTANKFDSISNENEGYKKRKEMFAGSKPVDVISWLHADIFHQDKYLINNVDLRIRFTRNRPEFYLLSGEQGAKYHIIIDDACLHVRKVRVNDSVLLAHAQILSNNNTVKYPLKRVEMRSFSIPAGLSSMTKDNIFPGQIPQRVFMTFVSSLAFSGSYIKNPYKFHHYNANYVAMCVDSDTIPSPPLTPDFENKIYLRCYQTLLENMDIWRNDKGVVFNRDAYSQGFTIFSFDLTNDGKHCIDYFGLIRQANTKLEIKFAKSLPESIVLILYCEFENLLEINSFGRVNFDYSS